MPVMYERARDDPDASDDKKLYGPFRLATLCSMRATALGHCLDMVPTLH